MLSVVGVLAVGWRTPIVINGMPFNGENELLDVRVRELTDVVDAFLVVESRYTQFGVEKPVRFAGHPNPKVIHVVSNWTIPGRTGCSLGWENEGHQRDHTIKEGLAVAYEHLRIPPYHMDILIMTDADEIPRRTTIEKIRRRPPLDGRIYPIGMSRYLYSFAWRERNGNQQAAYGNVETWRQWKVYGINPTWGPLLKKGGGTAPSAFGSRRLVIVSRTTCAATEFGGGLQLVDPHDTGARVEGNLDRGVSTPALPTSSDRRGTEGGPSLPVPG